MNRKGMKQSKGRNVLAIVLFVIGIVVSFYLSSYLHLLLSGQIRTIQSVSFMKCFKSMVMSRQHLLLFLCLLLADILLTVFFYFTNTKPYQSDLMEVTEYIKTPVATGQYQFGSARWMMEEERETVFSSFDLNISDEYIKTLLEELDEDIEHEKE